MSKRNQLDKYPNYMTMSVTQTAADTATTTAFATPIPRLQTRGGKATVMELLWIDMNIDTVINATGEGVTVSFYGGSQSTSNITTANPRGIAFVSWTGSNTITSGNVIAQEAPVMYNLQSKDGYGYLFAGDAINLLVVSANTGVANVVNARIYYRFVEIPITEFVGLVQSQQQTSTS